MPENDLLILNWLLTKDPGKSPKNFESVGHWKKQHAAELLSWSEPADMAIAGGFLSGCPAYAFAVGYWAALHRLLPDLPKAPVPALCVSEKHGTHPAKIACRLEDSGNGWRLNGKKHFVTCGREADLLLVAASTGLDPDGKNRLRLVRVGAVQNGIAVAPLEKPLTILPEISHGTISFSNVAIAAADMLPGDGYLAYIKPFRTIEDLHVSAAILGYLARIAGRYKWSAAARTELLTQVITIRAIARADYTAPEIHIAAAGALSAMQSFLKNIENCWKRVDAATRFTWQRDRAVLDIAVAARAKRLAAAWQPFK